MHDIKKNFVIKLIKLFREGKKKFQERQITENITENIIFLKFRREQLAPELLCIRSGLTWPPSAWPMLNSSPQIEHSCNFGLANTLPAAWSAQSSDPILGLVWFIHTMNIHNESYFLYQVDLTLFS
jgi:hypothetical protein